MTDPLKALIVQANYKVVASYYDDWLDAFTRSSLFQIELFDLCKWGARKRLKQVLSQYDLVVLHHSTNADNTFYLERVVDVLAARKCLLAVFVGNEYNQPVDGLGKKRAVFARMQPDYICTQLLKEAGEYLYADIVQMGVVAMPHALNPKHFDAEYTPQRKIDVGVRTFKYPYYLGDEDRNRLLDQFRDFATSEGLVVDISSDRLARPQWAQFLTDCSATIATEAGTWYLSKTDQLVEDVRDYVRSADSKGVVLSTRNQYLRRLFHMIPWNYRAKILKLLSSGVIKHDLVMAADLDLTELQDLFFAAENKCPVYSKCISSRHFDAIGTRTVQLLLEGRYNDILRAGEHYIEIKADFSNLDEVIEKYKDLSYRSKLCHDTYEYILDCHTYEKRVQTLYSEIC